MSSNTLNYPLNRPQILEMSIKGLIRKKVQYEPLAERSAGRWKSESSVIVILL